MGNVEMYVMHVDLQNLLLLICLKGSDAITSLIVRPDSASQDFEAHRSPLPQYLKDVVVRCTTLPSATLYKRIGIPMTS